MSEAAEKHDVIIVGYGGAVAAIAAHDAGADVLVLEKSPAGGGNTRLATSSFASVLKGSAAKAHLRALSGGTVDESLIDAYVEWAAGNVDFVRSLGGEPVPYFPGPTFPDVVGAETMLRFRPAEDRFGEGGRRLWQVLSRNVERRGIQVLMNARARKLLQGPAGEVIGVEFEREGRAERALGRRAVVLACGGFEFDEERKRDCLAIPHLYAFGHSGNTGDGIRMAQAVGAALWHMNAIACPLGYKFSEYEAAFDSHMPGPSYIVVDQYGERFMNEAGGMYTQWLRVGYFVPERLDWPRIPCFYVFDERVRSSGPVSRVTGRNRELYEWSHDNSIEIERGWIVRAGELGELGEKLGLRTPERLAASVERYNRFSAEGRDADFGRPARALRAIDTPPYYGIRAYPCLLNTQGGPKRNASCQVLDPWDRPIPGLYATGELGSMWGFMYQSGGNLGECLAFGRIAGMAAAREAPRDV